MIHFLYIAAGGAIGATLRHGVNIGAAAAFGAGFPYGTLIVNILGSFVMGALVTLFAHMGEWSQELRGFLTIGILSTFTTFSAFSLEVVRFYERGELLNAGLYIIGSVIFAIGALFAGMALTRLAVGA